MQLIVNHAAALESYGDPHLAEAALKAAFDRGLKDARLHVQLGRHYRDWLRFDEARDMTLPVSLSAIAVALLAVSGWLGGKMVYVHGIAVTDAGRRRAAPAPYHGVERRSHARG